VAAYCCAYLLSKAGFAVDLEPADRPRLPVILLGDQALALIRDIFDQPGLFADAPRIRKRVVAWGPNAKPLVVEHSAVLVSEEILLRGIRPALTPPDGNPTHEGSWTIFAARPLPASAVDHCFGSPGVRGSGDDEARLRPRRLLDRIARRRMAISGAWLAPFGRSPSRDVARPKPGCSS